MPYATKTDMLQRYGAAELQALSDITSPRGGAIVDSVLEQALADASAWIDSHLVGRYPMPISDTQALAALRLHCTAEARFLLMTVRADDAAIRAHEERVAFFRAVAKGDISIMPPAAVPAAAGAGPVVFEPGQKVFGREESAIDDRRGGW